MAGFGLAMLFICSDLKYLQMKFGYICLQMSVCLDHMTWLQALWLTFGISNALKAYKRVLELSMSNQLLMQNSITICPLANEIYFLRTFWKNT